MIIEPERISTRCDCGFRPGVHLHTCRFYGAPDIVWPETLSKREQEVLKLLGEGNTVGAISRRIFLSPKTITTYRVRIFEKLNLGSYHECVIYCMRVGLTPIPTLVQRPEPAPGVQVHRCT